MSLTCLRHLSRGAGKLGDGKGPFPDGSQGDLHDSECWYKSELGPRYHPGIGKSDRLGLQIVEGPCLHRISAISAAITYAHCHPSTVGH